MDDHLLTSHQVAAFLGINEQQVRKLTRLGLLAGINISTGRVPRWRYDPEEVRRFIESRRSGGA